MEIVDQITMKAASWLVDDYNIQPEYAGHREGSNPCWHKAGLDRTEKPLYTWFVFEANYSGQADLVLVTLLPQSPQCLDYRHPCLPDRFFLFSI